MKPIHSDGSQMPHPSNAFDFGNHQFADLIGFARHWVGHHVFVNVGLDARLIAMNVNRFGSDHAAIAVKHAHIKG